MQSLSFLCRNREEISVQMLYNDRVKKCPRINVSGNRET